MYFLPSSLSSFFPSFLFPPFLFSFSLSLFKPVLSFKIFPYTQAFKLKKVLNIFNIYYLFSNSNIWSLLHQTLLSIVSTTFHSTTCFLIHFVSFNYKFISVGVLSCSKFLSPILAIYASSDYLLLPNIGKTHQCRNTLN